MAKLRRNEACSCGKKYKHCCLQQHEAAMSAAESYESPEEADLDVDEIRAEYDRVSASEKAELIASSSKQFLKFTNIYMTDKLMRLSDLSELQLALRAIFCASSCRCRACRC
jgi:hypothetical protein